MKLFLGEDGVMKVYMAAADEHTVITAYFSPDRLKEAIDFYKSKQPGLSNDPNVVQVVDKMPAGSQVVVLMSLSGIVQMGKQAAMLMGGPGAAFMPEIADSPPLGFGGKLSAAGVEAHVVITADTLRSIGDGITNMRAKIRQRQLIPQR
jgi:hypothetical protein